MTIDKFWLYLLMSGVLGGETGYFDATAHLNMGFWGFFGEGPEGLLGIFVVQFLGWYIFRERK